MKGEIYKIFRSFLKILNIKNMILGNMKSGYCSKHYSYIFGNVYEFVLRCFCFIVLFSMINVSLLYSKRFWNKEDFSNNFLRHIMNFQIPILIIFRCPALVKKLLYLSYLNDNPIYTNYLTMTNTNYALGNRITTTLFLV